MYSISCQGEIGDFRMKINYFRLFSPSSELELHFKMLQYRRAIFVSHDHPYFSCYGEPYICTVILLRINTMNLPYISSKADMSFLQGEYSEISTHLATLFVCSQITDNNDQENHPQEGSKTFVSILPPLPCHITGRLRKWPVGVR